MTIQAWLTVGTIIAVIAAIASRRVSIEVAMVGALTLLMLTGVLEPTVAVSGFSHPAVIMIGALFVVAAGLEETGGMALISRHLLGRPTSLSRAQWRMMAPVAFKSAFMNNTPVVAMYLPIINDWAKRLGFNPTYLFMPLSFAAILGGTCTLIGTASNITVNELYLEFIDLSPDQRLQAYGITTDLQRFGISLQSHLAHQFWWMAAIGVPVVLAGLAFIALCSRWLLPARITPNESSLTEERQYTVGMIVQPDSPVVGKNVEEAELRSLPGLYLTEIERDGKRLPAVPPDERLCANDRLMFVGVIDSVVDLRKIRGLVPATDQVNKIEGRRLARSHAEAVISNSSPLIGKTVRESRFRTVYNAAIIAIHRSGHRIAGKIGDIRLRPGDTLLLVTHPGFVNAYRNSDDFYLVSQVAGVRETRHEKASLSLAILGLLVGLLVLSDLPPVTAVLLCAMLMIATRCISGGVAVNSIKWQILVSIAAAIGIGNALKISGAAEHIATQLLNTTSSLGPYGILFLVFMLTSVFSELITHNGAAALMFPITMSTVGQLDVNPNPFVLTLIIACACTFMTPMTYQTNLMVYGPGGYHFFDYFRLGFPLTLITAVITALLAPAFFPF